MNVPAADPGCQRRRAELASSLAEVKHRIERACTAAGRPRTSVRLLAVTKTFPALDVALLATLGVGEVAENREQEASEKVAEVARLCPSAVLRWHLVGRLQRNKARSVARWAAEIQSVDSERLVAALAQGAHIALDQGYRQQPLNLLVQVSLDGDPARGGCPLDQVAFLASVIARSSAVRLGGLMAVAPLGADLDVMFGRLARAGASLRQDHPTATELSAGMSGDLEQAIGHGSTCVRVGTALLGGRSLASP